MYVTPHRRSWLNATDVAASLEIGRDRVAKVAKAARIRTRRLPGLARTEFFREDVARLAESYSIPSNSTAGTDAA